MSDLLAAARTHLDAHRPDEAARAFADAQAAGATPTAADYRTLAALYLDRGQGAEAFQQLQAGLRQYAQDAGLWNIYGALLAAAGHAPQAIAAFERADACDPADPEPLKNALAMQLGLKAESAIRDLLDRLAAKAAGPAAGPASAWSELVAMLRPHDRPADMARMARVGLSLHPGDQDLARAWLEAALQRFEQAQQSGWALGASEADEFEAAAQAVRAALGAGVAAAEIPWTATAVAMRLCDYALAMALGSLAELGRRWAAAGERGPMLYQLARVETAEDRAELLEQHRLWGRGVEATAGAALPAPSSRREGPLRVGFLSSDLRNHAVAAFAAPLFRNAAREGVEVHAYSFFPGPADERQQELAGMAKVFRHWREGGSELAARTIAAEGLDALIEMGGPTGWNRPDLLARRLAPVQISWLGYPHSLGLAAVDYVLVDPYLAPERAELLLEQPLKMPSSWIALDRDMFREEPRPAPTPPAVANGFITFGTANSAYKCSPAALDLWARVLAQTPGSRFLFVRPESAAPTFRKAVLAAFASRDVAPERIEFEAVRGGHLPFYHRMDVSLDTGPVTGGTTTCESLWMGVPVVTLVGEGISERLSYSILSNVDLPELCARSADAFVAAATTLAADLTRLRDLRATLRDRIKASALGKPDDFAHDFYRVVAGAVEAQRAGTS